MKKVLMLILCLLLVFTFVSCDSDSEEMTPEEEVIRVVKDNLNAMNDEDVDAYMESISASSDLFEATKQQMQAIFSMYDLEVSIEEIEVIEVNDTDAKVRVKQKTINNNDADFQTNVTTAVHTLSKVDGEWKIVMTSIENTEFMD